jgi:hypothetical protein
VHHFGISRHVVASEPHPLPEEARPNRAAVDRIGIIRTVRLTAAAGCVAEAVVASKTEDRIGMFRSFRDDMGEYRLDGVCCLLGEHLSHRNLPNYRRVRMKWLR